MDVILAPWALPPWNPLPAFDAALVPQPINLGIGSLPPVGPGAAPMVVPSSLFAPAPTVPVGWFPPPAALPWWLAREPEPSAAAAALLVTSLHVNRPYVSLDKWYVPPAELLRPPMAEPWLLPPVAAGAEPDLFVPIVKGWDPEAARVIEMPAAVWDWYRAAAMSAAPVPARFGAEGGDALRWYLTGAASDGGSQAAQTASLGNYRSSSEAERCGIEPTIGAAGLSVELAAGANYQVSGSSVPPVEGLTGTVDAVDVEQVRYTGPGSSVPGAAVQVSAGESVMAADGADRSQWVRVTRAAGNAGLSGQVVFTLVDQLHNVFGMSDALEAESAAGGNRYRAVMLRANGLPKVRDIRLYVGALGAAAVSSGGALGGAGGGSVTFAADALLSWPYAGWARVETAAGALREIVYYASRTGSVLTVPAAGRGRLGTSAAAGAVTDRVTPVPGIRIAWELASGGRNGPVQTIANESTAPAAVSWSTAITAAAGVAVGSLDDGQQGALWIHRELPAGAAAGPRYRSAVRCAYVVEGAEYVEHAAGLFGVQDTDLARYELVIGSAIPALEAASSESFAALPHTTSLALTAGTYYYRLRRRNKWGLAAEPVQARPLVVVSSGGGLTGGLPPPTAPTYVSWTAAAGGTFRLRAAYVSFADSPNPATEWLVYLRTNGTDPDPAVDSPTVVALSEAGLGLAWLDATYGPYAAGTDGRVLVRVRRASDSSASSNTNVLQAIASGTGPAAAAGKVFYQRVAEEAEG